MQSGRRRHLEYLIEHKVRPGARRRPRLLAAGVEPILPPEFNWRDYAIHLLHVAAEIEHSLMVQYLFAAYSMGGPQAPARLQTKIRRWQQIILGIAKEEMGHLMTVQNVLIGMGGPIHFERQEYPWESEFYPFQFSLKPLTLGSVAEYVLAESEIDWNGELTSEIKDLANLSAQETVNHVGVLYKEIQDILARPERSDARPRIEESTFQPQTLPLQASWDTWGRGYVRGQRGQEAGGLTGEEDEKLSPELLLNRVVSRDSALFALRQVAQQGEALPGQAGEESHFERFLTVYTEIKRLSKGDQMLISRPVAHNPVTHKALKGWKGQGQPRLENSYIENEVSRSWGHLFNLRYRMLLVNLAHSMHPIAPRLDQVPVVDRGIVINRTFAEMYNLRIIANGMLELPMRPGEPEPVAGPPFELPYTLDMPTRESNRWRLQLDLLEAAQKAIDGLQTEASPSGQRFLDGLRCTDEAASDRIRRMLAGEEVFTLDERPA